MKNINPLFEDNEDDSNASAKNDAVDSKGKDSSNGKDSNEKKDDEKKDDEKKDDEKKDDEETLPIKFIKCWMFGSSGKWVKDVTDAYNSESFKTYAHESFPGYKYPKIWGEGQEEAEAK